MASQKVKFVTGFGSFGGSTVALLEHCRLLREHGFDATIYAEGDWHMGRFGGSRKMSELSVGREDIVVHHHLDLRVRPRCKRSLLYLHEKSLWDLRGRNLLPFDSVVCVSEGQRLFHGVAGPVVPNPVSRMVDSSRHHPPGGNVAGIVGTIQSRKRQHLSIERALADGRDKVLLFGDFEPEYFERKIRPILSDRVVYMGMFDPDERMEMYNLFDHLYMFSSEEAASLVLGECKILGKRIFKSEEVEDYETLGDEEIVSRWRSVFEESTPVIKAFAKIPAAETCGRLVCVVTHDRTELVSRWLRAWNNSEKHDARIAVFHACDSEKPDADQMHAILSHTPDFYVPFKNGPLRDMGALHMALRDAAGLPDWENIFWFTDDMIPMRRDFLTPFVEKLGGEVGMVAQCYEPVHDGYVPIPGHGCLPHIRTVAYALTREAADMLVFPDVGEDRDKPHLFEHGRIGLYEDHILKQIVDNGLRFELCHSEPGRYVHWTQSMDWMWDCHLFADGAVVGGRERSSHEMWSLYESQFSAPGTFDPVVLFTAEACERKILKPGKVSAIIPTFSSPMACFMWSVFSVVLRSDPSVLDHVFVSINGPDGREGGNELQDNKQRFLEDLRSAGPPRPGGFDPGAMTITRTWSRVGHAQALEQCIPWVDTEFYLSMHDDVLVVDPSWCDLSDFGKDRDMALKTWGSHIMGDLRAVASRLSLPHLNTIFTLCRKPLMTALGSRWTGFHVNGKFRISEFMDPARFVGSHRNMGSVSDTAPSDAEYDCASLDIGAFMLSGLVRRGLKTGRFRHGTIKHFESASWKFDRQFAIPEAEALVDEIMSVDRYREIYLRYLDD